MPPLSHGSGQKTQVNADTRLCPHTERKALYGTLEGKVRTQTALTGHLVSHGTKNPEHAHTFPKGSPDGRAGIKNVSTRVPISCQTNLLTLLPTSVTLSGNVWETEFSFS